MPRTRRNLLPPADLVAGQLHRDAELIGVQPVILKLRELHHVVRLLLVSKSPAERRVVALHVYHSQPVDQVAARLELPAGKVKDLLECVRQRLASAEASRRRAETVARTHERLSRSRRLAITCPHCGTHNQLLASDPRICTECVLPLARSPRPQHADILT